MKSLVSSVQIFCFLGKHVWFRWHGGSWGLDVSVARPLRTARPFFVFLLVLGGIQQTFWSQEAWPGHDDTHTQYSWDLVRFWQAAAGVGELRSYHLATTNVLLMQLLHAVTVSAAVRDGVSFTKVILCGNKRSLFSLSRHWQIQCQWRILVLSRACTCKPVRYCTARVSQFEEISDASSIHINSLMQCDELHAPFGFHFSNCSLHLPSKLHSPRLSCWLLPPVARCNWHLSVA